MGASDDKMAFDRFKFNWEFIHFFHLCVFVCQNEYFASFIF